MVVIRMRRMGAKKRPFYRIVAADKRSPRDGKFIEELGTYDPFKKEDLEKVNVDGERVAYWLKNGAQPSEKVAILLAKLGIKKSK